MNRIQFYSNLNKYKDIQEKSNDELKHYGIKDMKWGVRRWQNPDGTFNAEGKLRYFGQGSNNTSSEEKIGGYTADHFHKNIYLKTDKNTLKKIKKYPDIYDTEGLTDDEILKAVRRVPKIPNARAYGREIREELYNTKLNKTRSKYYETNTKDIPESEDIEEQKIGGLFSKKTDEEKAEKKAIKEAKRINDEYEDIKDDYRHYDEFVYAMLAESPEFEDIYKNIRESNNKKLEPYYKRVDEIFDDFEKDEINNVAKGGIAAAFIDKGDKATLKDIAENAWFYVYEDGDQGYANAETLYARFEKKVNPKEINDLYDKLYSNKELIQENVAEMKKHPVLSKVNDKLLNDIAEENNSWHFNKRKDTNTYWDLYNAADGSSFNGDVEKNAYSKAKTIAKKLEPSCGNTNGWDYLNQAIQNLGLSSAEVNNLSSSDWDKINTEINRLKN